jgi:hypothetical protein
MKRAISIFLLILMAFTSVHATWAFHYCGGSLHSFGIAGGDSEMSCCEHSRETKSHATDCPDHSLPDISQPVSSCCSNHTVEVATDNYSLSEQVSTQETDCAPTFLPFTLNRISVFSESGETTTFPPGRLAQYGIDLLALICTFRI